MEGALPVTSGRWLKAVGAPAEVGPEPNAETRVHQEQREHCERFGLAKGIKELAVAVDDDVPEEEACEQRDSRPDRGTPAKELPSIGDAEGDHIERNALKATDEHDDPGGNADLAEER